MVEAHAQREVTIRAYQWCQPDGNNSGLAVTVQLYDSRSFVIRDGLVAVAPSLTMHPGDLPFLLFEIWGRPQAATGQQQLESMV